jgi:hypothetical protein
VIDKAYENVLILEQGMRLLRDMDDESYRREVDIVKVSSIGAHIRHNLDHYSSFFAGLGSGTIDYDARERRKALEVDRQAAREAMQTICQRLAKVNEIQNQGLQISLHFDQRAMHVGASLNRELDFLLSHTIHHFAIIAILCRLQNVEVEKGFGVALSTLRYRKSPAPPQMLKMSA